MTWANEYEYSMPDRRYVAAAPSDHRRSTSHLISNVEHVSNGYKSNAIISYSRK